MAASPLESRKSRSSSRTSTSAAWISAKKERSTRAPMTSRSPRSLRITAEPSLFRIWSMPKSGAIDDRPYRDCPLDARETQLEGAQSLDRREERTRAFRYADASPAYRPSRPAAAVVTGHLDRTPDLAS